MRKGKRKRRESIAFLCEPRNSMDGIWAGNKMENEENRD